VECPYCKTEHMTYDKNNNLARYSPPVCVICGNSMKSQPRNKMKNPMEIHLENMAEFVRTNIFKSLQSAIRQRDKENLKTSITDEDMLRLHIDIALKNNDRYEFYRLTNELRELKGIVK